MGVILPASHFYQVFKQRIVQVNVFLAWILLFDSILKQLGQLLGIHVAIMVLIKVQKSFPNIVVVRLQFQFEIFLKI